MKNCILLFLLQFYLVILTYGQSAQTQQGIIFKTGTSIRLGNLKILNKTNGLTHSSNLYGVFNMPAKTGDTLEISGDGYQTKSIAITDFKAQIIFLEAFVNLPEVVIKGHSHAEDLQAVQKGYRDKGVFYTGRPHYYYLFLKPMTFIYENFKSEVINARKWKKYEKRETDNLEISKGFNDEVIKQYTPIKDNELVDFEWRYKPSVEQVKYWSDYDLIDYIKNSYQKFKSLQVEK